LREAGFRTTSLGILASGVLEALGGVFTNGGGNPGGKLPGMELNGVGALVGVGTAGSMPAALSRSSRELGSGTGEEAGAVARDC
jgi:hypothetical protein